MAVWKSCFRSWVFCILWIVYCAGCILWVRSFAKIHMSFSWFPTPIFIGEVLLFVGMLCTLPEILNSSVKTKRIILVSSIALFVATVIGFIQHGPLAFRHGAVFAYVFFGLFLYQHVIKWQILAVIGFVLYVIFLPIRFGFSGNEFYAFSVWALASFALDITLKRMNIEKTKCLICVTIFTLLALPLYSLFYTSRTFIVANCVSFLCLFSGILMISRASALKKNIFSVLCVCALLGCVYFLADRNALRSMVNIKDTISAFKFNDQEYIRLKKDFKFKEVPVAVYRPIEQEYRSYVPISQMAKSPIVDPTIAKVENRADAPVSYTAKSPITKNIIKKVELRSYENAQQNFLFRVFLWKGIFEELFEKRAFFGFGLGKPLRPMTTQVLGWTNLLYATDGWVSAHNSWFQLIYLFGIVGVFIVLSVWFMWGRMFFRAVHNKDFWGVFLCSALCNFMVGACSQPMLEQPHYAIFFWGLWGIVFRQVYVN